MLVEQALRMADASRLDAELLLAHALDVPKEWLWAHPEHVLSIKQQEQFIAFTQRKKNGEPVAYITGKKEFYGREFIVTFDVLIPRPATEHLVDVVRDTLENRQPRRVDADTGIVAFSAILQPNTPTIIVDVGTGSGSIAITLAKELPGFRMIGIDTSRKALAIAEKNAAYHQAGVDFRHGSLLRPIHDIRELFFVVSNPPYIPEHEPIEESVKKFEPHEALFAGNDGMAVITDLVNQCRAHPLCCGFALECRSEQAGFVMNDELSTISSQ